MTCAFEELAKKPNLATIARLTSSIYTMHAAILFIFGECMNFVANARLDKRFFCREVCSGDCQQARRLEAYANEP